MARRLAVLLALALAVGGCSGDDEATSTPTTTAASVARTIELAIDGEGLLVLRRDQDTLYAGSGSFTVDDDGRLVTSEGDLLTGWAGTDEVNDPMQDLFVTTDGRVTIDRDGVVLAGEERVGQIAIAMFSNPEGLEELERGRYRPTSDSGVADISTAGVLGRGTVVSGAG